jgi:mannose-6-phosphate isomerase-like protein (cupin superfamily)
LISLGWPLALIVVVIGWSAYSIAAEIVEVVPATDLKAAVARTAHGVATYQIAGPEPPVLVARRDGPGEVEIHSTLNDVMVVQEGHATLLIGDRVQGSREIGPNERRGGTIVGGRTYNLGPGDVIWIPAGRGHQMTVPPAGSITYLVVKTEAHSVLKDSR